MVRKCKVCGDVMAVRTGDHYRNTSRGRRLFTNVKQYTCPRGCAGAFFDFRRARPMGSRERIFFFIPVPRRVLNVVDPLLLGGLALFYLMFVAGIWAIGISPLFKAVGIAILTGLAALLLLFMSRSEDEDVPESGAGEHA